MTIKTSRNLVSSLQGAAFRRAIWDGRSRLLRSIKTHRTLHLCERASAAVRGRTGWIGHEFRDGRPIQAEPLEVQIRRVP